MKIKDNVEEVASIGSGKEKTTYKWQLLVISKLMVILLSHRGF